MELKLIGVEDNAAGIIEALAQAGLLALFSPTPAEGHAHRGGLAKFDKMPTCCRTKPNRAAASGHSVSPDGEAEPREKQALAKHLELSKADTNQCCNWKRGRRSWRRAACAAHSANLRRCTSLISTAAPDQVMFLLYASPLKPVQDRLRGLLPEVSAGVEEITARGVGHRGSQTGAPGRKPAKNSSPTD